jgi:sugar phosphate isomerase/epimerase
MRWGYNTNGFAHHRLEDALTILADLGYDSVAITLDHHALNPFDPDLASQLDRIRTLLQQRGLRSVIETGARFLLDPRHKHQPTLVSASKDERDVRLEFLRRAVDIAQQLGADACDYAAQRQVRLAFEPEPGMFIDTMAGFAALHQRVAHPLFGLTIDIGHLHCQGETPIADQLRHWRALLWNVHIEDMRRGVHDHLMFGEGEIDFGPVLRALYEIGYTGGVHIELSRHSHDAVETARQALEFLRGKTSPKP